MLVFLWTLTERAHSPPRYESRLCKSDRAHQFISLCDFHSKSNKYQLNSRGPSSTLLDAMLIRLHQQYDRLAMSLLLLRTLYTFRASIETRAKDVYLVGNADHERDLRKVSVYRLSLSRSLTYKISSGDV